MLFSEHTSLSWVNKKKNKTIKIGSGKRRSSVGLHHDEHTKEHSLEDKMKENKAQGGFTCLHLPAPGEKSTEIRVRWMHTPGGGWEQRVCPGASLLGALIKLLFALIRGEVALATSRKAPLLLMRDSFREWLFLNDSSVWAEQPNRFASNGSERWGGKNTQSAL